MKKMLIIVFVLFILSSCRPHRMSCGARGICETPEKQTVQKPKTVKFIKV